MRNTVIKWSKYIYIYIYTLYSPGQSGLNDKKPTAFANPDPQLRPAIEDKDVSFNPYVHMEELDTGTSVYSQSLHVLE
jgi:hypothetical protein